MNIPQDREYTRTHEWVLLDGETATVGVTAYDVAGRGISGVDILAAGTAVRIRERLATIAHAAGTRELPAPLSGTIVEINPLLAEQPELVRLDPYGRGWLCRLNVEAGEEIEHLQEPAVYAAQVSADTGGGI